MERVSKQCFSKPAPWAVAKRIKERALGFRAVQVLIFAHEYKSAHGHEPSYRTIQIALNFSDKADVQKCVKRLEKRGLMLVIGNHERNWHLPAIQLL